MRTRSSATALATVVIAAVAAGPAAAQTQEEPTSEAGATAVVVDGVAAISETHAAHGGEGSAEASVLKLGDETVVGGTQEGNGEQQGEIVTTGEDNEDGYLTVGGWSASVDDDRSHARSAVVDGNLGGEGISATALESESTATSEGSEAETTGVRLQVGEDLEIELLRATTSSAGEGESYILAINGEQVLSSEQADGQCEVPADPLFHLLCLYAEATEGEDGATGGNAGVADITALDENLTGRAFDAEALAAPAGDEGVAAAPAGETAAPAGTLPRTGGGLVAGLLGLVTMGAGVALRRIGR